LITAYVIQNYTDKLNAEADAAKAHAALAATRQKEIEAITGKQFPDMTSAPASVLAEKVPERVEAKASKPMSEAEKKRRFAPEGIVYNLKPITVTVRKKSVTIAPESELKIVRKNSDGTLHIQKGELEADVLSDDVTNDRDWVAAYRTLNQSAGSGEEAGQRPLPKRQDEIWENIGAYSQPTSKDPRVPDYYGPKTPDYYGPKP
jgi:hypothetical protein